jgi:hypothetical protein
MVTGVNMGTVAKKATMVTKITMETLDYARLDKSR